MKKFCLVLLTTLLFCCMGLLMTACGESAPEHTHAFTKQVLSEEYLASPATCESPAKYYYVCTCWEKGEETFDVGNALGHNYKGYVSNGDDTHSIVCTNDTSHRIIENCSGGNAALTGRAICSKCNEEYGEVYVHVHSFNKKNINNKYKATDATCTERATYYYSCECGEKGTLTFEGGLMPSHTYGDWVNNKNGTHTRVCKKNATHKETESCSGGTPDAQGRATCTTCGGQYVDPSYHTHVYTNKVVAEKYMVIEPTCEQKGKYYYSCACGETNGTTFETDTVPCKYENGECIWCKEKEVK